MKKILFAAAAAALVNLASGAAASGNLITNGDFSAGATGFTTGYSNASLQGAGTFQIHTSPATALGAYPDFQNFGDRTTGTGLMFIGNGSTVANTTIWSQTVAVQPFTDYTFSFSVTSVNEATSPSEFELFVNGDSQGSWLVSSAANDWWDIDAYIYSDTATSLTLRLVDPNLDSNSNDFALDNISLTKDLTGAVPEPASWAMMLIGFGAIGAAARSRRNPAALVA